MSGTPVAALDLRSPAPPRCASAWSTPLSAADAGVGGGGGGGGLRQSSILSQPGGSTRGGSSSNPFDDAAAASAASSATTAPSSVAGGIGNKGHAYAVAYGTERGSLHFRAYPTVGRDGAPEDAGAASGGGGGSGASSRSSSFVGGGGPSGGPMIQPLLGGGGGGGGGGHHHHHHHGGGGKHGGGGPSSHLQPVDLNGAVPGVVMGLIRAYTTSIPTFLVLVDDNRGVGGSSSSSPGAYASHLVSLRHGTFTKVGGGTSASAASSGTLPRMSAASYHPDAGFVYAAGNSVMSLPASVVSAALSGGEQPPAPPSSSSSSQRYHQQRHGSVVDLMPQHRHAPVVRYGWKAILPSPARSGQMALALACDGRVAVVAANNTFFAVPSVPVDASSSSAALSSGTAKKVLSFSQSSQVHPAIVIPVVTASTGSSSRSGQGQQQQSATAYASIVFLALGRECAVVDISCGDPQQRQNESPPAPPFAVGSPRHGVATLASPILSACSVDSGPPPSSLPPMAGGGRPWRHRKSPHSPPPLVAFLTSDGLVHTRSPSCLAIPLTTVEVGNRPNNFFALTGLPRRRLLAVAYSGDARVVVCRSDTPQDLADRMMKLSIDAFGANGFPRAELAEAINASFSATSYVGPEPSDRTRTLLRQYLEAVLGLSDDSTGGAAAPAAGGNAFASSSYADGGHDDDDDYADRGNGLDDGADGGDEIVPRDAFDERGGQRTAPSPISLSGVALLCLVCSQSSPPNASLANRAAKMFATGTNEIAGTGTNRVNSAVVKVCESIADRLINESSSFSLLGDAQQGISSSSRTSNAASDFLEAALWLLRSCGRHERAIDLLRDRMRNPSMTRSTGTAGGATGGGGGGGIWSLLKYETYTASHLGELWSSGDYSCCNLVLRSPATKTLLEQSPQLGLSVFTGSHPRNERRWREMPARDDPLYHPVDPRKVVTLLKSVRPSLQYDTATGLTRDESLEQSVEVEYKGFVDGDDGEGSTSLPLTSGRAMAVTFLESAIGVSSGRPVVTGGAFDSLPPDADLEERAATIHDELAYLLLEGVISERGSDDSDRDTDLGLVYRSKLRRFLGWPNSKCRAERILASLPSSFLREHALLLGRLGRHEDALRILYCDLQSLDLALEYCDARHAQKSTNNRENEGGDDHDGCTYLPLVRVALESDPNSERGVSAAIQVLALRRDAIDRGAALRLLPENVPVSAVARPFLIPALVDSESQVRRLKVAAALLRSRYVELKRALTEAQISSQAALHTVPALRSLNLGELVKSFKPFRARPSHTAAPGFPDVTIIKHVFTRHMVIQAKVMNSSPALEGRTLGDVAFVVAESSDEAILPAVQVPIRTLPPDATGSTWCALTVFPARLEETVFLTCELRYTILAVDAATGAPLSFSGGAIGGGRTFVEELQDIEVRPAEFIF